MASYLHLACPAPPENGRFGGKRRDSGSKLPPVLRPPHAIRVEHPGVGVACSQHSDTGYTFALPRAKDRLGDVDELVRALWVIDPSVVDALVAPPSRTALTAGDATPRELAILREMPQGPGEVDTAEIEIKAERQVAAALQSAQLGRPTGGPRPFGYLAGGMELHPVEEPAVRAAYASLLAGTPLREIARDLNRRGNATSLVSSGARLSTVMMISRLAVRRSPRRWPRSVPMDGREISPAVQVGSGLTPLPAVAWASR